MKILDVLTTISIFPIPIETLEIICTERGISSETTFNAEVAKSKEYKLAKADCYKWLVYAPSSMSENGISFSLSDKEKERFKQLSDELYKECGEKPIKNIYGYKGENF
jgi:hypothetical protein